MGPGATALGALLLLLGQDPWVLPNPQCLDYKPPFQPPQPLAFCPEYSAFGCCDGQRDAQLSARFQVLGTFLAPAGLRSCGPFLRDLLCQECSPYAAHLYDAEDMSSPVRALPGLCPAYCAAFWLRCRSVLSLLTEDPASLALESEHARFCGTLGLGDPSYCYPAVVGSAGLGQGLGQGQEGARGCLQLCLREVANGLRNPVAMVHAGDGSHRFFVAEQRGCVWVFQANGSRAARPFLDLRAAVLASPWAGDDWGFLSLAFHPPLPCHPHLRRLLLRPRRAPRDRPRLPVPRLAPRPQRRRPPLREDPPGGAGACVEPQRGAAAVWGRRAALHLPRRRGASGGPLWRLRQRPEQFVPAGQGAADRRGARGRGPPHRIPPHNPFVGQPGARPEVYACGVRNVWRCSVDGGDP
ncbi:unnamed protein product [Lepidochelys kempii]